MNNKKSQFLSAVRIIAPNDSFILDLAECVSEEALPDLPGGVALKFVTALSRLCEQGQKLSPQSCASMTLATKDSSPGSRCIRRVGPVVAAPVRQRCDASAGMMRNA